MLTPGSGGSVTDSGGAVWTLPISGIATRNGVSVPGGGGTNGMQIQGGLVFSRDAAGGQWYWWNGSAWIQYSLAGPGGGTNPSRCGDFFNMLCIQAQFPNSLYQTTTFATDAVSIGARHFRSGAYAGQGFDTYLTACGAAGVTQVFATPFNGGGNVVSPSLMVGYVNGLNALSSGLVYAVESINEPSYVSITYNGVVGGNGASWAAVAEYTRDLYTTMASTFPGLPCFSVSLVGGESDDAGMQWLVMPNPIPAGVQNFVAAGTVFGSHLNEHFYPLELQYYGSNVNGPPNWNVSTVATIDPVAGDQFQNNEHANNIITYGGQFPGYSNISQVTALPRVITEFGYRVNSPGNANDTTPDIQGKAILTGMLNAWQKGYFLFSIYELYDPARYGIFNGPNNPKASGQYLRNFATIMNDTSPTNRTFTTNPLDITITGLPAYPAASSQLFQSSDGTFKLALWQNADPGVSAVNVTVSVPGEYQIRVYDPTVSTTPTTNAPLSGVTVSVSYYPTIITFVPLSLEGTQIFGPSSNSFVAGANASKWSIVGGQVYNNGSAIGTSSNVVEIEIYGGTCWYKNSSNQWYRWGGGSGWVLQSSAPSY